MNRDIVFRLVLDIDDEGIAILDLKRWPREHPIHCDDVVGLAQPLHWCCLNLFQSIPIAFIHPSIQIDIVTSDR